MGGTLFLVMVATSTAFNAISLRPYIWDAFVSIAVIFGYLNGYVTARYLKFFSKTEMLQASFLSAVAIPMCIFSVIMFEMLFNWIDPDPRRYRYTFPILQTTGWYLLNALLCYFGAFKGYLQIADQKVAPTGQVARQIPKQPWYLSIYLLPLATGFI